MIYIQNKLDNRNRSRNGINSEIKPQNTCYKIRLISRIWRNHEHNEKTNWQNKKVEF